MSRLALCLSLAIFVCPSPLWADYPTDESAMQNSLAVQQALETARVLLVKEDSKGAVAALEEQLPRANGNPTYLRMLREAYRVFIKDLWLTHQGALAQRYLDRLCVLEPSARNDASLRPPTASEVVAPALPTPVVVAPPKNFFPKFPLVNPFAKTAEPKDTKPSATRAKPYDPEDDPLLPVSQVKLPKEQKGATAYLQRAQEEFARRRFSDARAFYEEAYKIDPNCSLKDKERFAFCMLDQVIVELKRPELAEQTLGDLKRQVKSAQDLAPSLSDTSRWLLQEIDQRHDKQATAPATIELALNAKHLGKNAEGWSVLETDHFRIFHHQFPDLAEKVARIAERTRLEMSRKWLGSDGEKWEPKCEVILHASGEEYSRTTGVPASSPGHSRIESDPSGQRIISRRMDLRCDNSAMLEAVLPHETTHVVLAGQFGKFQVPRWADEGIAVLAEPKAKIEQHRRNMTTASTDGTLFTAKELLTLSDYPPARRISAFYAESVSLVDFLTAQHGPATVTQFIRDAVRDGYDVSLRKNYDMDMTQLQTRWTASLRVGPETVAAGR